MLAGFIGHIVTGKRLDKVFVFSGPKHMHVDPELIQRLAKIVPVLLIAREHDHAHGMQVNMVGVAGEIVLVLAQQDRKSTRLNSSHVPSSYAGLCWHTKTE